MRKVLRTIGLVWLYAFAFAVGLAVTAYMFIVLIILWTAVLYG